MNVTAIESVRERIFEANQELLQRLGRRATRREVQAALGGTTSMATVNRYCQEWEADQDRREANLREVSELPAEVLEASNEAARLIYKKVIALTQEENDRVRHEADLRVRDVEGRLEASRAELHDAYEEVDRQRALVDEGRAEGDRLRAQIDELRDALENERRRVAVAEARIDEVEKHTDERRAEFQAALADKQDEIARLTAAMERERTEAAAILEDERARLANAIAAARDEERKAANVERDRASTALAQLEELKGRLAAKDDELKRAQQDAEKAQAAIEAQWKRGTEDLARAYEKARQDADARKAAEVERDEAREAARRADVQRARDEGELQTLRQQAAEFFAVLKTLQPPPDPKGSRRG